MKKYMFKRILFSIFSLLVVVMLVMLLVYSLIERNVIFQQDDVWNKRNNNDRRMYEYAQFQKYGYLNYVDYTNFLREKYMSKYGESYDKEADFATDRGVIQKPDDVWQNPTVQEFKAKYEAQGYKLDYMEPVRYKSGKLKAGGNGYLVAVQEKSVVLRLWDYMKNFFTIETKGDVEDPNLTERYVHFEKDPYSGLFAITGSGTTHKYLLYFDSRFPFIHQNFLRLNLGTSYTTYRGSEITQVITSPTGVADKIRQQYPAKIGTDEYVETAIDFHSVIYNPNTSEAELAQFGDNYSSYTYRQTGLSMLETSFIIGIISLIIAYSLGLPLGILVARRKDKLADKLGNAYIIFIMAVPSLAYIFLFAAIGTTLFDLPYKFANSTNKVLAFVLPVISLALPQIGGLMKWMRRYMIDQMNSDYVKFARAEGLSEKEIYRIHISRNALIYLVHGIPSSILFCLTGAIMTERVYGVPGVGNLLTTAINKHDNGIIVACTVFYTSLSILAVILGDVLLAKYDPRISLSSEGGGGR